MSPKRFAEQRDEGSMPLAMLITFFVLVMSVLALGTLAVQVARNGQEQATTQSAISLNSGVAAGAQTLNGKDLSLCGIKTATPATFTTAPDGAGAYRYWADLSDVANRHIRLIVEGNSGNRAGAFTGAVALTYVWNADKGRWVVESRDGLTSVTPAADNLFTPAQASFEGGSIGNSWVGGGTLANSAVQAADGTKSLALTATSAGTATAEIAQTSRAAITPGQTYTAYAVVQSNQASGETATITLYGYNAAGGSQGFGTSTATPIGNTGWTVLTVTGTAPATIGGTPTTTGTVAVRRAAGASNAVTYIDKVGLWAGTSGTWAIPEAC